MIKVIGLSVGYGEEKVFQDLSFEVKKGELVRISGRNGSGKSTLCYALSGIIPRNIEAEITGGVFLNGRDIMTLSPAELAGSIGIVIQNPDNMLFSPTVEDELAFAPENLMIDRAEIRRRVDEALLLTDTEKFRYMSPVKLSGGEKQRVAIASVLTLNPEIIIFDEVIS
jgi:energy-coupling factor transport system ATP-binding protein